MTDSCIRLTLDLKGILQGVGFRPTMARLAQEDGLSGWVRNQAGTVRLCLEGGAAAVDNFVTTLAERLPLQARLDGVHEVERVILTTPLDGAFQILESDAGDAMRISIPADLKMCPDCRSEVLDPHSRYYRYPFTTCTNCGPRYTVVEGMPYDRERTALREFPLCDDCNAEYTRTVDRRFHAESIACPQCGPRLFVLDAQGEPVHCDDPLLHARRALQAGQIVAVRGLGGFLLAADAFHPGALGALRDRKARPHKPFAVMMRNTELIRDYCQMPEHLEQALNHATGPIAILDLHAEPTKRPLPVDLLAPYTGTLGVMLPTTPLHLLLAEADEAGEVPAFDALVMTSGNRGGEPICVSNLEAVERLRGIADLFLCHNREINLRNDDSLVSSMGDQAQVWRRARGYAPSSLRLAEELERPVLAFGAELKNTLAIGFGDEIVLSPHIGDLETPEALDGMQAVIDRFPAYFKQEPQAVAVDLHPDMHSTRIGRAFAERHDIPVVEVQHHHAHAAACMAEHGLEQALALVFDGTGYGTDGTIWGAELLLAERTDFRRLGTFAGVPLPGGDAAVRDPVRQLVARWLSAGIDIPETWRDYLILDPRALATWKHQCSKGLNAPTTHAAGRVFDAYAAALFGPELQVSYEGLAAIRLEALAKMAGNIEAVPAAPYSIGNDGLFVVDFAPAFAALAAGPVAEHSRPAMALGFHRAVVEAALEMAEHGRRTTDQRQVVLSGGVMMNRIVCENLAKSLRNRGFEVFLHRDTPPNDGAIALGQAWIAGGLKSCV